MTWLVLGLFLWMAAHLFKRIFPRQRAALGRAGRPVIAALIVTAVVLMVKGYGEAEVAVLWQLEEWAWHLNNIAMYIAVCLSGLGHAARGWVATHLRHAMLWGAVVWALAHLLVNGDMASLVLFGGLGLWAFAQMAAINRMEGPWPPQDAGSISKDAVICAAAAFIYAAVVGIHYWLGYQVIAILE